ncbi:TetR/AcrR family transcriptional regulator [Streptomyces sp. NPDC048172]|uniref:TetR/AcrR family transcriptional regulator n=1 Tax=Streptomyces sp. NPDC048172 TaxID=3365505 RepID=UPI0037103515
MGHREDLLEGAKRCLLEKGWRATARDIVAASGTNLASIGYHYGSKDTLMREALFSAMGDWGDEMQRITESAISSTASPAERFETAWSVLSDLFDKHRTLWAANFEAVQRSDSDPQLRSAFVAAEREAQAGLVALFHGVPDAEVSQEDTARYGPLYHLLVSGMVAQKTLNPDSQVSGENLIEAMRLITDRRKP